MAEQSTTELDWKSATLLVGLMIAALALITALAIHFGYGEQLSQAVRWAKDHHGGIEYVWERAPEWFESIRKHAPEWLKEHPLRKL